MPKPTIAIIGLGRIGSALATNFAKSNRPFIAASKDINEAKEAVKKWDNNAMPSDIPNAVKQADIIILPIPFEGVVPFLKEYANDLEGKIIVDPTNPFRVDQEEIKKGIYKFIKIIGEKGSGGEINAAALPENAKLVKTFGTMGFNKLESEAFRSPERAPIFFANDDTSINSIIEEMITDEGFAPLRVGGINQSIRIEIDGDLYNTSLPQNISLAEAKSRI